MLAAWWFYIVFFFIKDWEPDQPASQPAGPATNQPDSQPAQPPANQESGCADCLAGGLCLAGPPDWAGLQAFFILKNVKNFKKFKKLEFLTFLKLLRLYFL